MTLSQVRRSSHRGGSSIGRKSRKSSNKNSLLDDHPLTNADPLDTVATEHHPEDMHETELHQYPHNPLSEFLLKDLDEIVIDPSPHTRPLERVIQATMVEAVGEVAPDDLLLSDRLQQVHQRKRARYGPNWSSAQIHTDIRKRRSQSPGNVILKEEKLSLLDGESASPPLKRHTLTKDTSDDQGKEHDLRANNHHLPLRSHITLEAKIR